MQTLSVHTIITKLITTQSKKFPKLLKVTKELSDANIRVQKLEIKLLSLYEIRYQHEEAIKERDSIIKKQADVYIEEFLRPFKLEF